VAQLAGDDEEDARLLRAMSEQAERYLSSFAWCKAIREFYFGDGVGGIIAIFFARIEAIGTGIDEWLWVVVGDIPPAYLVTDVCHTPKQAAEAYIKEMCKWVAATQLGQTSEEIIPVNVPATSEWAEELAKRLDWVDSEIVPRLSDR
jgi:hypothetical protein